MVVSHSLCYRYEAGRSSGPAADCTRYAVEGHTLPGVDAFAVRLELARAHNAVLIQVTPPVDALAVVIRGRERIDFSGGIHSPRSRY